MERKGWLRDWGAIGISILALGVSAYTALSTVVFQHDDLQLVLDQLPRFEYDDKLGTLRGAREQGKMTIINSGNRTAAITGVTLVLHHTSRPEQVCFGPEEEAVTDVEPFTIDAGEIVVKPLTLRAEMITEGLFGDNAGKQAGDEIGAGACLRFDVVTPGLHFNKIAVRVSTQKWPGTILSPDWRGRPVPITTPGYPMVIYKRSSNIFGL